MVESTSDYVRVSMSTQIMVRAYSIDSMAAEGSKC